MCSPNNNHTYESPFIYNKKWKKELESPIVVLPKSSREVRSCVDMGEANEAVKRGKHLTPTTDDLVVDLKGGTFFSKLKLHLSSGYHQLELEPESRHITTEEAQTFHVRNKRRIIHLPECNRGDTYRSAVIQEYL